LLTEEATAPPARMPRQALCQPAPRLENRIKYQEKRDFSPFGVYGAESRGLTKVLEAKRIADKIVWKQAAAG